MFRPRQRAHPPIALRPLLEPLESRLLLNGATFWQTSLDLEPVGSGLTKTTQARADSTYRFEAKLSDIEAFQFPPDNVLESFTLDFSNSSPELRVTDFTPAPVFNGVGDRSLDTSRNDNTVYAAAARPIVGDPGDMVVLGAFMVQTPANVAPGGEAFLLSLDGSSFFTGFKENDPARTLFEEITIEVNTVADDSLDFGDAPDPYPTRWQEDGAIHRDVNRQGFTLGSRIDFEDNGLPDDNALGDDNDDGLEFPNDNRPDDEDGVTFDTDLIAGETAAITVEVALPDVLYHSQGFESPVFSVGDLTGQDPIAQAGPWIHDGTSGSATVQTTVVHSGTQAIQIDRVAGVEDRWAVVTIAPTLPNDTVLVEWDMRVDAQTVFAGNLGPFMGIEAYDTNRTFALLGAVYVNATTGDLITLDSGSIATETGHQARLGSWHHYAMHLDFANNTYTVLQDNVRVDSRPFVDLGIATITSFTDASIAAIRGAASPMADRVEGTAYIDNYVITEFHGDLTTPPEQMVTGNAELNAWIDFNGNGTWEEGNERIIENLAVEEGTMVFNVPVPANATAGDTYARFRLSQTGGRAPTGAAIGGEVEDYKVTIKPPVVTIGAGAHKTVSFTDADGSTVNIILKDKFATADVTFSGDNLAQVIQKKGVTIIGDNVTLNDITIMNSSVKTKLDFKGKGGANGLADIIGATINADRGIKTVGGKKVNFDDVEITINGPAKKFRANHLANTTVTIQNVGQDDTKTKIQFIDAMNFVINSTSNVEVKGNRYVNDNHMNDGITATYITNIKIKQDAAFAATITKVNPKGISLKTAKVGNFLGGTWTGPGSGGSITAASISTWDADFGGFFKKIQSKSNISETKIQLKAVGKIEAKGAIVNTDFNLLQPFDPTNAKQRAIKMLKAKLGFFNVRLTTNDNIGKIEAGKAEHLTVRAGVNGAVAQSELASNATDFVNQNETTIAGVKIKGIKGEPIAMRNVLMSAFNFGKIATAFAANDTADVFGFAGVTFKGFIYKDNDGTVKLTADQFATPNRYLINPGHTLLVVDVLPGRE